MLQYIVTAQKTLIWQLGQGECHTQANSSHFRISIQMPGKCASVRTERGRDRRERERERERESEREERGREKRERGGEQEREIDR